MRLGGNQYYIVHLNCGLQTENYTFATVGQPIEFVRERLPISEGL